ncbi:hypothetical protein J1605_012121 [Eschrichtius robustus]|uniref:Uncharacterized protein n=1 Tax=Eschrichtius robustus TaxID=9764 RepID=A0AB34GL42_ESCRO|nr:hypothetical protein J1605_012121 [Eschrichtius robustus]
MAGAGRQAEPSFLRTLQACAVQGLRRQLSIWTFRGGSACASLRVTGEEGSLTTRKFEYHSSMECDLMETDILESLEDLGDTCLSTPHPVAPDCRLPVAPGPQCHVHCLPCRVGALQLRHPRPALCFLQPSYPQRLSVMRVIVWVLVLATTLPELLSLRLILLPYPLTLEVAKVDSLFSYLFSKLPAPVLSPYSYPIPLLSKKSALPSHVCMCPGCPQPQVRALHTFRPPAHLCT